MSLIFTLPFSDTTARRGRRTQPNAIGLSVVLPFLALAVAGCAKLAPGGSDPLFGRTAVEPPATGSAAIDPAYTNRALTVASNPSVSAPNRLAASAANASGDNSLPLKASNSSLPLNVAPAVDKPINPITVTSNTTYTPAGNASTVANSTGLTPNNSSSKSSWFPPLASYASTSATTAAKGPGPKMTRTRVTPMSLSGSRHDQRPSDATSPSSSDVSSQAPSGANRTTDNRPRTFGQLGQIVVDRNNASTATTAASSAAAAGQSSARAQGSSSPWPAVQPGSSIAPNRIQPSGRVIDIMDLPPKATDNPGSRQPPASPRYGGTFGAAQEVHRDAAVRPASATVAADNPYQRRSHRDNGTHESSATTTTCPAFTEKPSSQKLAVFTNRNKYAHAEDHTWLKGRLEYSQAHRRWKLRYIPIDGKTDRFGGSVVLSDDSLLVGCEHGDFVQIRGRLSEDDTPTAGEFAAAYEITQIKRLD